MKYASKNRLCDFEFHDSEISFDFLENGMLGAWVSHLNIHRGAKENSFEQDMEIERAHIVFESFLVDSYEVPAASIRTPDGKIYTEPSKKLCCNKEAEECLIAQLKNGATIFDFGTINEGYYIDASASGTFFTSRFKCGNIIVEWDNYIGRAWYTDLKDKNKS